MQDISVSSIEGGIVNGYDLIMSKLKSWLVNFFDILPNFIAALIILIIFWQIARFARRTAIKFLANVVKNETILKVLTTVIFYFIIFEGLFVALSTMNLEKTVTQLLAGAGILGLALSFAFQSIATNIISGIIIAATRPLKLFDLVETNGFMGVIDEIGLRIIKLKTFDGQDVFIPAKEILEQPLKNYGTTPKRRIMLQVGVSYGEDLEKVREITLEAAEKVTYRSAKDPIILSFASFDDSAISFELHLWLKTSNQTDYLLARSDLIIEIKKAYDAHDITIPFPIRTLDFGIKGGKQLDEVVLQSKG
ncbi:MAG: mechanosensitive ion channel family protein [Bacteroidota bacterium]